MYIIIYYSYYGTFIIPKTLDTEIVYFHMVILIECYYNTIGILYVFIILIIIIK